jgi:photosystem II stability/assembly factor-like uncharacterized protein
MVRRIGIALGAGALLALACYEPPPPEEPLPAWYWHEGPTASDLYDLASTARNDVWAAAVNDAGAGEIFHFASFRWAPAELPPVKVGPLYAVAAEPGGEAWAAGGGDYFLRWDGTAWRSWPHPAPGKNVYGLALVDELSGWAVGEGGLIFKFGAGEWTAAASPTTQTLRRVRALSRDAAWAVGEGGTVLRYDGSSWKEEDFPPQVNLYDLHFFAADDGWVVGAVASLYRWNGSSFKKYQSPDPDITYQCCGFARSKLGWAGGNEMHLSRYQDDVWKLEQNMPGGSWQLTAIHMVSATEGWAVGPRGAMMHYY